MDRLNLKSKIKRNSGFSLAEILISIAIFSVIIVITVSLLIDSQKLRFQNFLENQSTRILKESAEAIITIKNRSFGELKAGEFGLKFLTNKWSLVAPNEDELIFFKRLVKISDLSPSRKDIIISVTTKTLGDKEKEKSIKFLLTNWINN